MRRFWFGVAAVMGVILMAMIVHYGKKAYDANEEAKMRLKNGTFFKR